MPKISTHFTHFKLLASKLDDEAQLFISDNHVSEMKDPPLYFALQELQEAAKKATKAISENLNFKPPAG